MRFKRFWISLSAVVAILAAWYWWPSETRRIERRLGALAAQASIAEGEGPLARAADAAAAARYFTEDVTIALGDEAPRIDGRDALAAALARMPTPDGGVQVQLVDVAVAVGPAGVEARATMTATARYRDPQSNAPTVDAREVEMDLVKRDGEWRIRAVRGRDTLVR
jgi:ketosteroid isomerase-like protein